MTLPVSAGVPAQGATWLFQNALDSTCGQWRAVDTAAQVSDLQPELQRLLSAGAISAPPAAGAGSGREAVEASRAALPGGAAAAAGGVESSASGAAPAWPAETLDLTLGEGLEQSWGREGWVDGARRSAGAGAAEQEGAQADAGVSGAVGAAVGFPGQTSADRVAASCLRCNGPVSGFRPGLGRTGHRAPSCPVGRSRARWPGLQGDRTGACVVRGAAACRGGSSGLRMNTQRGLQYL